MHSKNTRISSTNKLVFCRYYDHKRHAAKKTQKTVEAAEKVFVFVFRRHLKAESLSLIHGQACPS